MPNEPASDQPRAARCVTKASSGTGPSMRKVHERPQDCETADRSDRAEYDEKTIGRLLVVEGQYAHRARNSGEAHSHKASRSHLTDVPLPPPTLSAKSNPQSHVCEASGE